MGKKLGQCVDFVAGICAASYAGTLIKNVTYNHCYMYELTSMGKVGYHIVKLLVMNGAGTMAMKYSKKLRREIGEMIFKEGYEYGED